MPCRFRCSKGQVRFLLMLHSKFKQEGSFSMKTGKINTRQLAIDAMLAAMVAVLGYVSIDTGAVKFTFESLPILIGALLFGPVDGMLIGGVGTLIYQILRYGVSATTLLWMAPYILCGALVGLYAKKRGFTLNRAQILTVVILNEILITILNTGVIYLDSKLYGYYYPALIYGNLALRFVVCILKAAAFGLILPALLKQIRKAIAS